MLSKCSVESAIGRFIIDLFRVVINYASKALVLHFLIKLKFVFGNIYFRVRLQSSSLVCHAIVRRGFVLFAAFVVERDGWCERRPVVLHCGIWTFWLLKRFNSKHVFYNWNKRPS